MIGNPCTAELVDHNAFFPFVYTHDLIPATLKAAIESTCPASYRYLVDNSCCQFNYSAYPPQSADCVANLNQMYTLFANNNLYDIYADCASSPSGNAPCIGEDGMPTFLDTPAIREALHAAPLSATGPWSDCTSSECSCCPSSLPTVSSGRLELHEQLCEHCRRGVSAHFSNGPVAGRDDLQRRRRQLRALFRHVAVDRGHWRPRD